MNTGPHSVKNSDGVNGGDQGTKGKFNTQVMLNALKKHKSHHQSSPYRIDDNVLAKQGIFKH